MSFEAVYNIAQAEAEGKALVAEAEQTAAKLVAEAVSAGKAAVAEALERAENDLAELRVKTEEKKKTDAEALAGDLETKKAVLLAKAGARLERAASLVVERIVSD